MKTVISEIFQMFFIVIKITAGIGFDKIRTDIFNLFLAFVEIA